MMPKGTTFDMFMGFEIGPDGTLRCKTEDLTEFVSNVISSISERENQPCEKYEIRSN